jgi:hypothetical protein
MYEIISVCFYVVFQAVRINVKNTPIGNFFRKKMYIRTQIMKKQTLL